MEKFLRSRSSGVDGDGEFLFQEDDDLHQRQGIEALGVEVRVRGDGFVEREKPAIDEAVDPVGEIGGHGVGAREMEKPVRWPSSK